MQFLQQKFKINTIAFVFYLISAVTKTRSSVISLGAKQLATGGFTCMAKVSGALCGKTTACGPHRAHKNALNVDYDTAVINDWYDMMTLNTVHFLFQQDEHKILNVTKF